ncbi:ankrd29, partial [Symbiodinium microadriaticum]
GSLPQRAALDCIEAQWQHAAEEWQFMRSHRDGASGLLQIGLSLQGRRYLSFGLHRSPEPATGPDPSVWDEEAWQKLPSADLTTLALNPGDVYVATPAVFEH